MNLRRIVRRVVLVLCLAVGAAIGSGGAQAYALGAQAVPAARVGGNDYPWQSASMGGMSPLKFAYRNCTDYVAFELNKQLGVDVVYPKISWDILNASGNGNASAWKQAAKGNFMVDALPRIGSVAWWGASRAGGYGHVALVTSISADKNSVTVDEYNTDMSGHFSGGHHLERGKSGWPEAFIHIADVYADGTYLQTDKGNRYVTAGGAALPVSGADGKSGVPLVRVMQRQIDLMPTTPREGTYLQAALSKSRYEIYDGHLLPLTDWRAALSFADGTGLASRYLQPSQPSVALVPLVEVDDTALSTLPQA